MTIAQKLTALLLGASLLGTSLLLTGCGGGPGRSAQTTLTVFAAASLKGAFEAMVPGFTAANPDTRVVFSFQGSQSLVDQLGQGARADVLATADAGSLARATELSLATSPRIFATNTLIIITPVDNPAGITGLDSSLDGAKVVICDEVVPCGKATATLARNRGVTLVPVSKEQKVSDVVAKITIGEGDAGIVYATDAKALGNDVHTVEIEGADQVVNTYPIATVQGAHNAAAAQKFVDHVTSDQGQRVLADFGFGTP